MSGAAKSGILPKKSKESLRWFSMYSRNFRGLTGGQLMSSNSKELREGVPDIGCLYMFFYDPKLKDKLPYFDRFPCIFVIGHYDDGFLGINLHYLNYAARVQLMDALYSIENNATMPKDKKLQVSYYILKAAMKYRWFKPCIKRYLTNHLRSKMLKVPYNDWQSAIFLPVQQFEKKSGAQIWVDSAKVYNRGHEPSERKSKQKYGDNHAKAKAKARAKVKAKKKK